VKVSSKVVYVAGPYSAPTAWQREQNIRRAEALTLELWERGVPAICVHAIARNYFGAVSERLAVAIDDALLDRCDAVLLVEGWEHSTGTLAEIKRATAAFMPIFQPDQRHECVQWAFAAEAA
jgi:hypothetical protein